MSISSIDTSTMAPRSAEASSIVGKEQQQLHHVGENGAASFERHVEQNSQRTVETTKSEKEEYRFDGSGSQKYKDGRKKKKKKDSAKEAPIAPRWDSSFDIMV